MEPLAVFAYVTSLACFFLKYSITIALQGRRRALTKRFRWAEDAAAFGGSSAEGDDPLVERAQHLLRNEGESLPFFFAAGFVWVALGAEGRIVAAVFAVFVVARFLHAWFLLRPKQPARVRAFAVSQLVLLGIVVDMARLAVAKLPG